MVSPHVRSASVGRVSPASDARSDRARAASRPRAAEPMRSQTCPIGHVRLTVNGERLRRTHASRASFWSISCARTSASPAPMSAASMGSAAPARSSSTARPRAPASCWRCRPMAPNSYTIEGLAKDGELHPLQQAFHENHGLQCGFCTPGMLMAALDFLRSIRRPAKRKSARRSRRCCAAAPATTTSSAVDGRSRRDNAQRRDVEDNRA